MTEEIITDSVESDSGHCMIAEAIKKALPGAQRVSVDIQTIRFSDPAKGLRYTYLTPRIAQLPLVMFDAGVEPEPFTFQLRAGSVTAMSRNKAGKKSPAISEGMKKSPKVAKNVTRMRKNSTNRKQPDLPNATLRNERGASTDHVKVRVGGKTPPQVPYSRRREFGLRALETASIQRKSGKK